VVTLPVLPRLPQEDPATRGFEGKPPRRASAAVGRGSLAGAVERSETSSYVLNHRENAVIGHFETTLSCSTGLQSSPTKLSPLERKSTMTMNRVRVLWQNFPGAPGYSNHYVGSNVLAQSALRTFYDSIKAFLPSGLTIQVPNSGDQVAEGTGLITGAWTGASQAIITATGTGTYPGSAGACVNWRTSGLVRGRRPMGRTFLVPLVGTAFETNGSIATAALAAIGTAASQLITDLAGELKVWSRPTDTTAGSNVTVTSANVPDLAVVLRSRRI